MNQSCDVNKLKNNLKLDDYVLISKDFDNNLKTKKLNFEGFFEKKGVITRILMNKTIEVDVQGKKIILKSNQVKKINN